MTGENESTPTKPPRFWVKRLKSKVLPKVKFLISTIVGNVNNFFVKLGDDPVSLSAFWYARSGFEGHLGNAGLTDSLTDQPNA